ncbi:MAG TPA: hypothetical protein PKH33_03430 [bacterium]|nr:hypothetical protein [bacterium]
MSLKKGDSCIIIKDGRASANRADIPTGALVAICDVGSDANFAPVVTEDGNSGLIQTSLLFKEGDNVEVTLPGKDIMRGAICEVKKNEITIALKDGSLRGIAIDYRVIVTKT